MMTSAAPPEARQNHPTPRPADCSSIREQRGLPIDIRRMTGLETAARMLGGKGHLADALGIGIRGLNYKLTAYRGVSNLDMIAAARALEAKATGLTAYAAKLRDAVATPAPTGEAR